MLQSIPFQDVMIVFIVSHDIPYCNLHIVMSSVHFRPNMIRQLLSHSIAYSQVAINPVPISNNTIHHLLSWSKAKPLCCNPYYSFLSNMIHWLPSCSIVNCHVEICSVPILPNWIHFVFHILYHTFPLRDISYLSVLV